MAFEFMSSLEKFIIESNIPERDPCDPYKKYIQRLGLSDEITEFFLRYTPHGIRSLGVWAFSGKEAMLEVELEYNLAEQGYVLFGAGQGYLLLRLKDEVAGFLPFGCLEQPELDEGFVPYPSSFGDFMYACETDEEFPFDAYEARELYA